MIHRSMRMAVGLAVLAGMTAVVQAATWTYVGTSGFTGLTGQHQDNNRFPINSIIVDAAGNIYATAPNGNNDPTGGDGGTGGLTIFPAGGGPQIDVSLTTLRGAVTKMVIAGDGKVYGAINWLEINWAFARPFNCTTNCVTSKIVRINPNGTLNVIADYSPARVRKDDNPANPYDSNWRNRITGLTVGRDGKVYWTISGGDDNELKYRIFFRYDYINNLVEPSPQNGNDNMAEGQFQRFYCLEYGGFDTATGRDRFIYLNSGGGSEWIPESLGWENEPFLYRLTGSTVNGISNPGFRKYVSVIAYDRQRKRLWAGGQGASGSNVMSRWHGDLNSGSPAFFTGNPTQPLPDRTPGTGNDTMSKNAQVWHTNGQGSGNGDLYYVAALAVNPADGKAWMAWGGTAGYNQTGPFGALGTVYTMGPDDTTTSGNEGAPQSAHPTPAKRTNRNHVCALTFRDQNVYALVFDTVSTEYNIYKAANPIAVPSGACCLPDGGCEQATASDCVGDYKGNGTVCGSVLCSPINCPDPFADVDRDGDVDQDDFGAWQSCYTGQAPAPGVFDAVRCSCFDRDGDLDVDQNDLGSFNNCASGPNVPADPACDNGP